MKKFYILFYFLFSLSEVSFSQELPNPKIARKETEITLLFLSDDRDEYYYHRGLVGGQFVYRVPFKKSTKIGGGILLADEKRGYQKYFYGAVFGDVVQFIGKRQKWSVEGQVGHGIYKEEYKFDDPNSKGFTKYIAGMYYTLSVNYRVIVSEKILMTFSPFISCRNFRYREVAEYSWNPVVQRTKILQACPGEGLRIGIVF